jgi:thiamine biosynthesis protein ThiS
MTLTLNGLPRECANGSTMADLLAALDMSVDSVVVEHNNVILNRALFAGTLLAEGDSIELVHMVGGG